MRVAETLKSRLKAMRPAEAEVARRMLRNLTSLAEQSLREVAASCRTADVVLPTQAVEPQRCSYAIAPFICQLAVLDALFNRVGIPNGILAAC